jgi:hypothetical protein
VTGRKRKITSLSLLITPPICLGIHANPFIETSLSRTERDEESGGSRYPNFSNFQCQVFFSHNFTMLVLSHNSIWKYLFILFWRNRTQYAIIFHKFSYIRSTYSLCYNAELPRYFTFVEVGFPVRTINGVPITVN